MKIYYKQYLIFSQGEVKAADPRKRDAIFARARVVHLHLQRDETITANMNGKKNKLTKITI